MCAADYKYVFFKKGVYHPYINVGIGFRDLERNTHASETIFVVVSDSLLQ